MSEKNHYIIDLKRLPVGTHFEALENSEILRGTVAAKATLNLREEDYSLDIAVQGTVFVVCDRCLDPMPIDINDEQTIESVEEEEPITDNPSSVTVMDLSWLAYEIVSINIPLVHSHQPGECNKQMELLLHDHLCDEPEPEE